MVKVPIETTPTPMDDEEKSNSNEPGPVETEATEVKKRSTRGRKPKPKPQAKSASVASTGSHRVFYLSGILPLIAKYPFSAYSLCHPQMISASQPPTSSWFFFATHVLESRRDTSASMSKTNIMN